jgi:hypothetical protein
VYRPVADIARGAPLRLTVPAHGCPDGWRAKVSGARGMHELDGMDYMEVTVIDADTLEFNELDGSVFRPWRGGGVLQYNTPMPLAGAVLRMMVKDKPYGRLLASSDAGDAPLDVLRFTVDPVRCVVELRIEAEDTERFAWNAGVYDIEIEHGGSPREVDALAFGPVEVIGEITTASGAVA